MRESWIVCIHELYTYMKIYLCDKIQYPTGSYLFKVNKGNIRAMRKICLKLKIKTPEQCQWRFSGFLISNFEHISLSISKCLLGTSRYNHFIIYCDNSKLQQLTQLNLEGWIIGKNCFRVKKSKSSEFIFLISGTQTLMSENYMLQIAKFLKIAGINCRESKKS